MLHLVLGRGDTDRAGVIYRRAAASRSSLSPKKDVRTSGNPTLKFLSQ